MDYTSLIAPSTSAGSIAGWVNSTAVQAEAPTIVAEAEAFIYRRLRHWKMLTSTSGTMTTSQALVTVPSDFLEDKIFKLTGTFSGDITRKTIQEVIQAWNYDGNGNRVAQTPEIFSNDQTNLVLDSPCDRAYPFTLYYYQQPAALGTNNTTNFLTTTYPRLMRTACMVGASEFMKDSGVGNYDRTYWEQNTLAEIEAAQEESDKHERSIMGAAVIL